MSDGTRPIEVLLPAVGQGAGVLVAHPWWGLNDTIRTFGHALAEAGFVVGIADLFDDQHATTVAEAEELMPKHFPQALLRLNAALAELRARPEVRGTRLGGVGFSFGGFQLLRLMSEEAPELLGTIVAYYATYPADFARTRTAVLAQFAETDPFESPEDVAKMTAAMPKGNRANMTYTYPGTRHWFAEANRPEYDPEAAALAFDRTVAFFRQTLG